MASLQVKLFTIVTLSLTMMTTGEILTIDNQREALLLFIASLKPAPRCIWNTSDHVCSWKGVHCYGDAIKELHIPSCHLTGPIPFGTLGRLRKMRKVSLWNNRLLGELPKDFLRLRSLEEVYLQQNRLNGSVSFSHHITVLNISFNTFQGSLDDLKNLNFLKILDVQSNNFSGKLPLLSSTIRTVNFSNNAFSGRIPRVFFKFKVSSFSQNPFLCGRPKKSCRLPAFYHHLKFWFVSIATIVAGVVLICAYLLWNGAEPDDETEAAAATAGSSSHPTTLSRVCLWCTQPFKKPPNVERARTPPVCCCTCS